jgi:hypothetical protein
VACVHEDRGEGMPAHDVHRDAVGEAIMPIRAPFIQCEAPEEGRMSLRQDSNTWIGEHAPQKVGSSLSETWSRGATDSEELG